VLVIDASGAVLEQEGVTFTATPTSIVVDPVVNTGLGTASFQTPMFFDVPQLLFAPSELIRSLNTISGADPFVINFHESLEEVHIENRSAKDMVIDDIHVVNTTVNPTVTINAELDSASARRRYFRSGRRLWLRRHPQLPRHADRDRAPSVFQSPRPDRPSIG